MTGRVFTPDKIIVPGQDEILVFGNNSYGTADTDYARLAREQFGAEMNNPAGLQGASYSVMVEGVTFEELKQEIDALLNLIYEWDQSTFLITPLAIPGGKFTNRDIAPLFAEAVKFYNIRLPKEYCDIIDSRGSHL